MQTIKRPETECKKQVLFIIFLSMIGSGKTSNGLTEKENNYSEKNITRESNTRILQLQFYFWKVIKKITMYPLWGMNPELNHQPFYIKLTSINRRYPPTSF
jgi:hypothetical protein